MSESKPRARYTLEFKLEAVRLVKGGQVAAVTAKILGIPKQTLENWVRLANKGQLKGAGDKPISPEQRALARLRAENARLRMERDILGKATAYFARVSTATKPCWPISGPSTSRSSRSTAGPRCGRNWWPEASASARSACGA